MPKKYTCNEIIDKFIAIHSDKYNYDDVKYIDYHTKVKIKCNACGEVFWQAPCHHISGSGCPNCAKNKKYTIEDFIKSAREIHGNKYCYDKTVYKNRYTKVIIICPEHGEFLQQPNSHLWKRGCPKCADKKLNTEEFVRRAKLIHGNKYDYSETIYVNKRTKVKIKCKSCNNFFSIFPNNHIQGKQGCPCQKPKSNGENIITKILTEYGIKFIRQYMFKACKYRHPLFFDFYLPDYNLCIEYQGAQHYENISGWGGMEGLRIRQLRDKIKHDFCSQNNIKLLEIRYDENIEEKLKEYFALF